jgi:predicted RNase H-like HicB family nuclease
MRFTAALRREGTWYVAQCLEVDVASQGETIEEALHNLREALELHFEDAPVPAESLTPTIIATVDVGMRNSLR